VLQALGLTDQEIETLAAQGVVALSTDA
jgi:hypothetical protein